MTRGLTAVFMDLPSFFTHLADFHLASPDGAGDLCMTIYQRWLSSHRNSVLLLQGELGAGKTTLTGGFASVFKIHEIINSPTFNLLNEYHGENGVLYHYDLYRLHDALEVEELGFPGAWCENHECPTLHVIEWWQRAEELFPLNCAVYMIEMIYDPMKEEEGRSVRLYRQTRQ